ncbi:MAG: A/G-specific adenine glycosylase [Saprospiraceae bacterium]|uniref:Adenine DNA glycosylase n=1 Tax=Candidatus Opimibacter skivensis TaxID=2982028 RepID=A0A9D7SWD7_9BACT|nr:A/G-specific adenine glycosylase [Candidatus Opimibacter skivensis]
MANFFARTLLKWHRDNPRPLPWATTNPDPYHIWLSEIIMQQTRIEQGTAYYLRFVNKFPTVDSLASASTDQVMRLWQGLGYYTRARNLHKAAKHIVENLDSNFPDTYEGLLALPGIGPYSAAAISSFAFGRRHAVVDGNVKRLIARFSGVRSSIDDASTHLQIQQIASTFMTDVSTAVFNQAIMNFGALVCKPKSPLCAACPLATHCFAFQNNLVDALPVRTKKKDLRERYFHFVVLHYRGKFLLQRRVEKDIWHGLYVPPLLESKSTRIPSHTRLHSFVHGLIGHDDIEGIESSSTIRQLLSHQSINGRFIHYKLLAPPITSFETFVWVSKKTMNQYGKPKMVAEMLNDY